MLWERLGILRHELPASLHGPDLSLLQTPTFWFIWLYCALAHRLRFGDMVTVLVKGMSVRIGTQSCNLQPRESETVGFMVVLTIGEASRLISSVQFSRVRLFATPWIAARQASLSITNSRSSLRLTSIESVMPSSNLILCRPLLLLPPIPPSIRVFSNESTLHMRWSKYWSFSFSIMLTLKSLCAENTCVEKPLCLSH